MPFLELLGRYGLAAGLTALPFAAFAQFEQPRTTWKDRWEAAEVMIPMRDGVKLHTVYFVPKGKTGPFPILMERTPYGSGTAQRPPQRSTPKITEAGYILAFQDVRGTGGSEGDFINVRPTLPKGAPGVDESTDTFDTVEYLVKNVPKNSNRVGLWGISYPGFYAGAGAIRNHPSLKAVSPQAPVNDWFLGDDVHHRGAMFMQESFDFSISFDVPRGGERPEVDRGGLSAYEFYRQAGPVAGFDAKFLKGKLPYWQELVQNDTYNAYWKERALWRSFKDVNCAVLTVGGLFDKEDMWGAFNLYKAAERQNKNTPNFLVMGPWSHGQWAGGGGASLGDWVFGSTTSRWYQDNIEFPFFERFLRGNESVAAPAEATVFETGANVWGKFAQWPPKGITPLNLYLGAKGSLSWQKPNEETGTTYINDPNKPTPYVSDWQTSRRAPGDWLALDQKFLEGRIDTATYRMPALVSDLRIGGPVTADLWVETSTTDADFVVQLIDEFPEGATETNSDGQSMAGAQLMVRGEIMRGKFRDSFEKPSPFEPYKPTRVKFELNDVLHTFKKGHRIVVRVQSSWFPIAEQNPNVFMPRSQFTAAGYKKANIRILEGGQHASRLELGAMPKG